MKSWTLLFVLYTLNALDLFGRQANDSVGNKVTTRANRINIIVSSRLKKVDPAPISFQVQAWLVRFFHKRKTFVIIAGSSDEMIAKAEKILIKHNAMIANIWFDSHGHYARRHALFEIGKDEFNARSIQDSLLVAPLRKLSIYCDTLTKAAIGSCYGGSTFSAPAIEQFPESNMKGDSLMIHLSSILKDATVFGSESWVMTGPGIFGSRSALSGYPLRKKFRDPFFEPAWQRLGMWNRYDGTTKTFRRIHAISLSGSGNIVESEKGYLQHNANIRKQQKQLKRLKNGNYNLAYLYQ